MTKLLALTEAAPSIERWVKSQTFVEFLNSVSYLGTYFLNQPTDVHCWSEAFPRAPRIKLLPSRYLVHDTRLGNFLILYLKVMKN